MGKNSVNLHGVARGAIHALHPCVTATLYQSIGQTTDADGRVKSVYAPGIDIHAQRQSASPTALSHHDRVSDTERSCAFYLFADPDPAKKVTGIVRPLSRGGDALYIPDDGAWWLVTALVEDFSRSGWVCVRATLQVMPLMK